MNTTVSTNGRNFITQRTWTRYTWLVCVEAGAWRPAYHGIVRRIRGAAPELEALAGIMATARAARRLIGSLA